MTDIKIVSISERIQEREAGTDEARARAASQRSLLEALDLVRTSVEAGLMEEVMLVGVRSDGRLDLVASRDPSLALVGALDVARAHALQLMMSQPVD